MKYFKNIKMKKALLALILVSTISLNSKSQTRIGVLDTNSQSIGIATGLDYSVLPLMVSYKRGFKLLQYKYPVNAGVDVTVPIYKFDFNDVRIRLITETTIYRKNNFNVRGGIDPVFVNLKMETEIMTSLGMDFHVFTGFTNDKWNVGLELNYNKIFTSYIKHTDVYRDNVFTDAVDGWYKNTAANIRLGALVNRKIIDFDVYLKGGLSKTGKLNDYLFVPGIYANIGVNYRF
jgi:hypothetical protein